MDIPGSICNHSAAYRFGKTGYLARSFRNRENIRHVA